MSFTSTILMIRPAAFGYNAETAANNSFQQNKTYENLQHKVLLEFDNAVASIRSAGIDVLVKDDTLHPAKPDAVFPNNWFCTMPDSSVSLFPMHAENRRIERRQDIIDQLKSAYAVSAVHNWSEAEVDGRHLEGTGSMVMDHQDKVIYACISERTNPELLYSFAAKFGYTAMDFSAVDNSGLPIYHTNVMMCIGDGFAIICDEVIESPSKDKVLERLTAAGKEIISIRYEQMLQFTGNMLQLKNTNNQPVLVMSQSAFGSLNIDQVNSLEKYSQLLPVHISTIETIGGGSARCMLAEIFLERVP